MAYLESVAALLLFFLGVVVTIYPVPEDRPRLQKVVLGLFAVLGLTTFFMSIIRIEEAHVEITPGASLNPVDPFYSVFTLSNDAEYKLTDLEIFCDAGTIRWSNNTGVEELTLQPSPDVAEIEAHTQRSIGCGLTQFIKPKEGATLVGAEIAMRVRFRKRSFFFFRAIEERKLNFVSFKAVDGTWLWIAPFFDTKPRQ